MNLVDLFLLAIILLAVYSGYMRGFIIGSISLISWILGLVAAFVGYRHVDIFLMKVFPNLGVWSLPVSFFVALIIARIILGFLVNLVLASTHPEDHRTAFNKILGTIPGLVNGFIYAIIISALLLAFPLSDEISVETRESKIAGRLAAHAEWIDEKLSPVFDEAFSRSMNKLTVDPSSPSSYELSFTVEDPVVRPELEAEMLQMVNDERRKEGLPALRADPEIREVAREHSKDMFAKGYFAHVNKKGITPAQRVRQAGVRYLTVGENLALGPTLRICHEGLMNSPGHRANILRSQYGRLGIGILDGGRHGLMVTQNFRN